MNPCFIQGTNLDIVNLSIIILLLVLTAFFVATEFAFVKVRSTRIEQLVNEGNKNAISAKKVIDNLDGYLSACQLGITITALGIGWLGEETIASLLSPLLNKIGLASGPTHILSFIISFSIITFLHVVLGELAPKTVAIQKAETLALWLAKPIIFFYKIFYPFIWLLNGSARSFVAWFGIKPATEHDEAHTEEEIHILLDDSLKSGEINKAEYEYVKSIFEFDETTAKDIMIPRRDMMVLDIKMQITEIYQIIMDEKFTRYPVIETDKDHVIGFINAKDITHDYLKNSGKIDYTDVQHFIRPLIYIHEATPVNKVLLQMQSKRTQMAIVVDDYGGTSGLVTVEDIVEEIVGEIRDEYDYDEVPDIQQISDNQYLLSGKYLLDDFNNTFAIDIQSDDIDTLGGWLLNQDIQVKLEQVFTIDNITLTIKELDRKYVKSILVTINSPEDNSDNEQKMETVS